MDDAWKQWEGRVLSKKFHLRQYLGGTAYSAVFLTEDVEHGLQKAAVKLILADPEGSELQLARWKEAANLSHPHLLRIIQTGRSQLDNTDLLYLVMEYAEVNLSQILSAAPLPPEEARATLKVILDVLAYLHGEGFVHGGLNPSNILGVERRLKLSSDRLCRIGGGSHGLRALGVYDAPETAGGSNSPAGDVWSLGITLVEALTQHPTEWEGAKECDPLLPRTLPAPFFDIARHCLRRDPRHRWTVAQIAAQLEPPASAPSLDVPRPQVSARPRERFLKRRYNIPAVIVGLALALILAGSLLLNRHSAPSKRQQAPVTRSAEPPTPKASVKQEVSSPAPSAPAPARPTSVAQSPTADAVEGAIRQKVLPDVPQSALDTIRGTVRVRVKVVVDPSGNVTDATLVSPGPSRYFANLALQAARLWKFQPAGANGQQISNEWILQFGFKKDATEVVPSQANP